MRYVKIYGEHRTCSNWAALVLEKNFHQTIALSNILGDKHEPHESYAQWLREHSGEELIHGQDIIDGTDLSHALAQLAIGCVITVKNPYAFVVSKFSIVGHMDMTIGEFMKEAIVDRLGQYNVCYRSWSKLIDYPYTVIVHHEQIMADHGISTLDTMKFMLDLKRTRPLRKTWLPKFTIKPHGEGITEFDRRPFEPTRRWYMGDAYMTHLTDDMVKLIDETVDWPALAPFGYTRGMTHATHSHGSRRDRILA